MEFAPNYKSGFEMAIIRMVLFTPTDIEKIISIETSAQTLCLKKIIIKKENIANEYFKKEKSIEARKSY